MKAALYCRLSEEDKNKQSAADESESIQNQKSMLLSYAMEQGWDIYNIYSDDDYAGADRNRPAFLRLLADAEQRKFDIVLCKTQSRFTRELELVEKYIHGLFPLWNIRFVSIVDNADTANRGNKKSRQINGLINEWYLEDMSENIKSVLTDKRKNGLHIGAFALYGYKKDPGRKGHLLIDEEAAAVVREVFTLFSKGYGKTAIARMLNDRGVPNPTEYKRLQGLRYQPPKAKTGTLWKYSAIANMLVNEIYIGNMVQGRYGSVSYKTKVNRPRPKAQWYRIPATHEPIIEKELWDRVQFTLAQRAKPFITGEIGLFANKARCMYCGSSMRSSKSRGQHYLQCANRYVAKSACIGSFISVAKLEQAVVAECNRLSETYLDQSELQQNIACFPAPDKEKPGLETELLSCRKKIAEYAKGIRELYLDKVKGILSENDYLELSHDFVKEKKRLEQLADILQERLRMLEQAAAAGNSPEQFLAQSIRLEHLNREMVEHFIDHILVGKRMPDTQGVPIEIHWNF